MAFNHVNGCSCPVGCCDCGSDDRKDILCLWYDNEKDVLFYSSHLPHYLNSDDSWLSQNIKQGKWRLIEINYPELVSYSQKSDVFDYMMQYGEVIINTDFFNSRKNKAKKA